MSIAGLRRFVQNFTAPLGIISLSWRVISMLTIALSGALAELAEERPDAANEQIGDFHGGGVAAPVEL